jgi:hypothetical protein
MPEAAISEESRTSTMIMSPVAAFAMASLTVSFDIPQPFLIGLMPIYANYGICKDLQHDLILTMCSVHPSFTF